MLDYDLNLLAYSQKKWDQLKADYDANVENQCCSIRDWLCRNAHLFPNFQAEGIYEYHTPETIMLYEISSIGNGVITLRHEYGFVDGDDYIYLPMDNEKLKDYVMVLIKNKEEDMANRKSIEEALIIQKLEQAKLKQDSEYHEYLRLKAKFKEYEPRKYF